MASFKIKKPGLLKTFILGTISSAISVALIGGAVIPPVIESLTGGLISVSMSLAWPAALLLMIPVWMIIVRLCYLIAAIFMFGLYMILMMLFYDNGLQPPDEDQNQP